MLEIYIISSTSDAKKYVIFLLMIPTQRSEKQWRATTIRFTNALARPIKELVSETYMFYVATMQEYLHFQYSSMKVTNSDV